MTSCVSTSARGDSQAVQPGGESRFATKGVNFAEHQHECFLREIFCFGGILYHAHANGIDAPAMPPAQLLEHGFIAILRSLYNFRFSQIIVPGTS